MNIFVTGYPKSGNTYLSRLLGDVLNSPVGGMYNAKPICEEGNDREGGYHIRQLHLKVWNGDDIPDWNIAIPNAWWFYPKAYNGEKIIHVVRHPFDVCVSCHHYWQRDNLTETIKAVGYGTHPLKSHGAWSNFVLGWLDVQVPVVRFEELVQNPTLTIVKTLDALDIDVPDTTMIVQAVERQSFDKRRKELEQNGNKYNYGRDVQLRNLRKGQPGDWRNYFDNDMTALASSLFIQAMRRYDYAIDEL